MEKNAVRKAVDLIGGILATQIAVEVNYWTLRDWMKSGVVPTTRYALRMSDATGGAVSVRELARARGRRARTEGRRGTSTATSCDDTPVGPESAEVASPLEPATACAA